LVNVTALDVPPAVTMVIEPLVLPAGITILTLMVVLDHDVTTPEPRFVVPPPGDQAMCTWLAAARPPKPLPLIVTVVPDGPEAGERFVMRGMTPKFFALLVPTGLTTVTGVSPAAPDGTSTLIWVLLQDV